MDKVEVGATMGDEIVTSDWNPHADLQAMARAHRLGQTNKVMIYRLITRGTIEERMIQMTKKKMVLEHLVVGRLKAQNINQEELDDIVRYGSKELFADENDEVGKSRQIHYDDDAIDRLLDRNQVGDEEAALDGEDEDGFLKAFKVANFEYIEEVEPAEEVAQNIAKENQSSETSSKRTNYWEELLKDRYEEHQVEELNALGKGKRNRNKWLGGGFSGLEDVSSDGEDENYKADVTDDDSNSSEATTTTTRRSHKKKARADSMEPLPLMEGEGKSLKVLGFNQSQRTAFVQLLMRFGVGDFDWKDFTSHMKQKTYEEIEEYGKLFLSHIAEEITDSPTFTDGVPKEGLRIQDVLVRIAILLLIKDKAKFASENPQTPLFSDDILLRYANLKGTKIWKEEHDLVLLHAVLKHGYGRWHDIVDDKDLNIQKVICQELNIPFTNLLVQGQVGSQVHNGANISNVESSCNPSGKNGRSHIPADGANMTNVQSRCNQSKESGASANLPVQGQVGSQVHNGANMSNVESSCNPSCENGRSDIAANGANMTSVQSSCNQSKKSGVSGMAAEGAHGSGNAGNQAQLCQKTSILHQFKDMQRRQADFIKRRVLLLEKGLNAEYQKEYFGDLKENPVANEEFKGKSKATNMPSYTLGDSDSQMIDPLPRLEAIGSEEIAISACDYNPDRLQLVFLYNEMCKTVDQNAMDVVKMSLARELREVHVVKNFHKLEIISEDVNRILNQPNQRSAETQVPNSGSSQVQPSTRDV
ncbi:CHD3-type chromatin-remodeling factor PICKLE [Cajanus cajan]|uniref:CHD3-type chromatin-remodeling factor PICKLE n=1 Tax=Cajanus cajan TaxID=3821 RepID=UPI00098D79D5|nr:CHD3-type chromatin-remodeling factor PICKLE [Cajanus cajan]